MRVNVRYGRIALDDLKRCTRCNGRKTQLELFGGHVPCGQCKGTGEHMNPEGYCYDTNGIDVEVGDVVMVPPTPVNPEPQEATVVSLTSNYTGKATKILPWPTSAPFAAFGGDFE